MTRIITLFAIVFLLSNCGETKPVVEAPKVDTEFNELLAIMNGSYNSANQAEIDTDYYDISLHMYPIWEGEGNFYYVEQALSEMQDRPYRQRVYELTRLTDSTFSSAIYNLEIDSNWIGKWNTPEAFDSISREDITLKKGCAVILKRIGENHFKGSTGDRTCLSGFRGAMYASSEVEVFEDKIISWDRGFDSLDVQVWGAEKGGYVFDKLEKE